MPKPTRSHRCTRADKEHAEKVNLTLHLWHPAHTFSLFTQITTSASPTLFHHRLPLYFHEKPVTDVIAYERADHYPQMITFQ